MKKRTLACQCGFTTLEPDAFVSHMLATGHGLPPGFSGEVADSGAIAELVTALGALQSAEDPTHLPGVARVPVDDDDDPEDRD